MNRQASFAALGLAAALVAGSALFLFVGIASGVWQPRGALPPRASPPQAGIPIGARSYDEFLDDVRAGKVGHVSQEGQLLQVANAEGGYTVEAPQGVDVFADMTTAAEAGGVDVPSFDTDQLNSQTVTYEEFLAEVEAGHIHDVSHQGTDIHGTTQSREFITTAPSTTTDVLADVEAAAERGGVPPPYYAKLPPGG